MVVYKLYGELLGMKVMPSFYHRGELVAPTALSFVCNACGDMYAQRLVNESKYKWATTALRCPKCSPGFLFEPYGNPAYIQHAPSEVLQRELSLIALLPNPLEYINMLTGK
jgi:hypothetical protein